MSEVRKVNRRDLVGRQVVNVTFEQVESSVSSPKTERGICSIELDNGRRIWFRAIELEGGGVEQWRRYLSPHETRQSGPRSCGLTTGQ